MKMFSDAVDVLHTGATSIIASDSARGKISITNNGSYNVYLGGDNSVTTATGLELIPGETFTQGDYYGAIWGLAETATCSCAVYKEELT